MILGPEIEVCNFRPILSLDVMLVFRKMPVRRHPMADEIKQQQIFIVRTPFQKTFQPDNLTGRSAKEHPAALSQMALNLPKRIADKRLDILGFTQFYQRKIVRRSVFQPLRLITISSTVHYPALPEHVFRQQRKYSARRRFGNEIHRHGTSHIGTKPGNCTRFGSGNHRTAFLTKPAVNAQRSIQGRIVETLLVSRQRQGGFGANPNTGATAGTRMF